jgi:luciferase family oxidoreductase group 1
MDLSILDISHTPVDGTPVEALANSIDLAKHAERLGYKRIWFAEHHGVSASTSSSTPEVLIARAAALTDRIRVGSGVVQLNHYSPFKVAETFAVLEAMSPGRIDLGIGRSSSWPALDLALRRVRSAAPVDDYAEQVAEVLAWLSDTFPKGHPFAQHPLLPGVTARPQPWLLGSSVRSAVLAGRLGMRYGFAGSTNPGDSRAAAETYAEQFRPSGLAADPTEPYFMYTMSVTVGATQEEGDRLRAPADLFQQRLHRGELRAAPLPDPDEAIAALGGIPRPSLLEPGKPWPSRLSGDPHQVLASLATMAAETNAKELIVQDMIVRPHERIHSYELLADAAELRHPWALAG